MVTMTDAIADGWWWIPPQLTPPQDLDSCDGKPPPMAFPERDDP